jgi:hypothetical protein
MIGTPPRIAASSRNSDAELRNKRSLPPAGIQDVTWAP